MTNPIHLPCPPKYIIYAALAAADACHGGPTDKPQSHKLQVVGEAAYNQAFCNSVGGRTEVRHTYTYPGGTGYVMVDCETATHVYEGGLDKRSSLDSIQQALFLANLTGKQPAVVIYDTDGNMGRFEYRIKTAAGLAGLQFILK